MPSPICGVFESTAGVAVRPNAWTDLTNHGASIISISCIFFQMPSPIRIHSRRRCSTECLDHGASIISISCISFQMPSPICGVFESTAGVAVRPNAWTDLTNHGASIISISCISFQMPSPIRIHSRRRCSTECLDGFIEPRGEHHQHQLHFLSDALCPLRGCSNPQQASQFDRMLGRI